MVSAVLLLAALVMAPIIGGGFAEPANSILQILVCAAIIVNTVVSKRGFVRVPGLIAMGVFALAVLVSVIFSASIYSSLKQLLLLSACMGAYLLSAKLAEDASVAAAAVWAMVLSALGICVVAFRDYAINAGGGPRFWHALLRSGDHARMFGPFVNPNFFAGFLVIALPLSLGLLLVSRRTSTAALAGLALAVETVALMLTGSKFGIIAALVALFVFFAGAILTKSIGRRALSRLIVVILILLPLVMVFSAPLRSRVHQAETGGSQVHSAAFRSYTWRATVNMIRANPWKGVGPGTFGLVFGRYEIAGWTELAHESYLQIGAESGIIALGAFILLLGAVAWRSFAGILKGTGVSKAGEDLPGVADSISWNDLVPPEGWRLMSCAVFASLVGSAACNLVDSDWYVMGIALPFWILAGVLVSRTGATGAPIGQTRRASQVVVLACGVCALISASFGLGGLLAPDEFAPSASAEDTAHSYELASKVSPLNPKYPRELAKCLAFAQNEPKAAMDEIDRSIRLSPHDAENYYIKGTIAAATNDSKTAVDSFRMAAEFNPNKPRILFSLAMSYLGVGDIQRSERVLNRLLEVENTPYEQVKGVPEMVDVTYAYAHAYFGQKYLSQGKYLLAAKQFTKAIDRLERWSKNKDFLDMMRRTGKLSPEEERSNMDLLDRSRSGLAESRTHVQRTN